MISSSSEIPHVIIACTAPLLRRGIEAMLAPFFGQQMKVLHAQTPAEIRHLLQQNSIQLLILEDVLAAQGGINWTEIKFTHPQLKVLVFTRNEECDIREKFNGYFDLNVPEEVLTSILLSLFPHENKRDVSSETSNLSSREIEILRMMVTGRTTKQIAEDLNLSHHTVSTHRKNIINKLGIKTLAGLTVYAIVKGIVDIEDMPKI